MELWARWVVAVVAGVGAVVVGVRSEGPVLRGLVRAAADSVWRAVGVVVAYFLVLAAAGGLGGLAVHAVRDRSEVAAVVLTGALFVPIAALAAPFFPNEVPWQNPHGSETCVARARVLRCRACSAGVATCSAWWSLRCS